MNPHKTSTPTLVSALRILAGDIQSDDGVANMTIGEGADRIEELARDLAALAAERDNLDAVSARQVARMLKAEQAERDARAEVSQLKGALALGQENCDSEYEALREERDAARADLKAYQDAVDAQPWATDDPIRVLLDRVTNELAELRRDKERLDWIEKVNVLVIVDDPRKTEIVTGDGSTFSNTIRAAIDAAMQGGAS